MSFRRAPALVCAVTCAGICGFASPARAAACCGTSFGVGGRLSPMEGAALSLGLRMAQRIGFWGSDGAFAPPDSGSVEQEYRAEADFLLRATDALTIGVGVPAL